MLNSPPPCTTRITVADPATIDHGVLLGYLPGRTITDEALRIGAGCALRSGTVIYAGSTIGTGFETGHGVIVREENHIGNDVSVWSHSVIDYGCTIGDRVRIHSQVYVAQFTTLEADVFLAPGARLANDRYPISGPEHLEGPIIRAGARIGVNATVLPGVEVGAGALVGAGAVVVHDVPAHSVVVGNPARVIRDQAPPPGGAA